MLPPELHDPLTLSAGRVSLVPLSPGHAIALEALAAAGDIWRNPFTLVPRPPRVAAYVEEAMRRRKQGKEVPFAILCDDAVVGTTRYQALNLAHRRLQIGGTWLGLAARRRGINAAAKRLLLGHAFDALQVRRVEFITHPQNDVSRRSLEALGARFEGVLRCHLYLHGQSRDSAVYSILREEWAAAASPPSPASGEKPAPSL